MGAFERGGFVFDLDEGGPPDGPPVVLLHGFPQDRTAWSEVAPLLHAAGLRTFAPDLRGVAAKARPREVSQYRTAESVRDVVALLDARGLDRAHIVGHDWGGYLAWALACEVPDRVATVTSVSTPHPGALRRSLTRSTQGLQSWYMALFQLPGLAERILEPGSRGWQLLAKGLPDAHERRYAERMAVPQARSGALNWYRVLRYELTSPSVRWRRVDLPTLYVWGERDPALGRAAAELTADFVTGPYRFEVLDAGHWIPERRPAEFAGLLVDHVRGG
jgi:pimeloyl-ACP methyl ester carboxylesterase